VEAAGATWARRPAAKRDGCENRADTGPACAQRPIFLGWVPATYSALESSHRTGGARLSFYSPHHLRPVGLQILDTGQIAGGLQSGSSSRAWWQTLSPIVNCRHSAARPPLGRTPQPRGIRRCCRVIVGRLPSIVRPVGRVAEQFAYAEQGPNPVEVTIARTVPGTARLQPGIHPSPSGNGPRTRSPVQRILMSIALPRMWFEVNGCLWATRKRLTISRAARIEALSFP
jgi:hypothetical protein